MSLQVILMDLASTLSESVAFLLIPLVLNNNIAFIKFHKYKTLLCIGFQTVYVTLLRYLLPFGVHSIFSFIFYFAMLLIILRLNLLFSFVSLVATASLLMVTELISFNLCAYSFGQDFVTIMNTPVYKFVAAMLSKSILFLFILLLIKFKIHLGRYKIFSRESSLATTSILLQVMVLLTLVVFFYKSNQMYLVVLAYLMILSLNLFTLVEREKMLGVEKKYVAELEHIKNMEVIIDVIRKEKHEFANQLNSLTALCLLEKENKDVIIEEYAKKLLHNIHSTYRFYDSGNTYVDGLLAVKSNFAAENDIRMDVSFDAPLSQIDIDDIDLTSIMGNIIDNALEAIKYSPNQRRGIVSIYTCIDYESNRYCISISNNGDMIPEHHMNRIFENRFSTKKNISHTERGYGLFITKQLIDKHSGSIEVTSTGEATEFLLAFNLKKAVHYEALCSQQQTSQ